MYPISSLLLQYCTHSHIHTTIKTVMYYSILLYNNSFFVAWLIAVLSLDSLTWAVDLCSSYKVIIGHLTVTLCLTSRCRMTAISYRFISCLGYYSIALLRSNPELLCGVHLSMLAFQLQHHYHAPKVVVLIEQKVKMWLFLHLLFLINRYIDYIKYTFFDVFLL